MTVADRVIDYIAWSECKDRYAKMLEENKKQLSKDVEAEIKDCERQRVGINKELDKIESQKEKLEESYILGNITLKKKQELADKISNNYRMYSNKLVAIALKIDNLKKALVDEQPTFNYTKEERFEIVQKVLKEVRIDTVGEFKHYHLEFVTGKHKDFFSKGVGKYGFRLYKYKGQLTEFKIDNLVDVTTEYKAEG